MVRPKRSAADLASYGLTEADFADEDTVHVWPENWLALDLYVQNRTQWIQGAGGPTGLNYPWFQSCLERQGVSADEAEDVMGGLRVIEDAVLEYVYRDR